MNAQLIVFIGWCLGVTVIFYRARHSFTYFLRRGIDKVTLLSNEEYKRRWDGPYPRPDSIPRPFLRPAMKKTFATVQRLEHALAAVVTIKLNQVTDRLTRDRHLPDDVIRQADVTLFLVDPHFAIELGFEAPRCVHCKGELLGPPEDWDGIKELRHLMVQGCGWDGRTDNWINTAAGFAYLDPSWSMEQERRERVS